MLSIILAVALAWLALSVLTCTVWTFAVTRLRSYERYTALTNPPSTS